MASVSSLGAGSGLDLSGLLTKLMQAEQQPLLALQQKEASYQSRISALGSLSSTLSGLQTAAKSLIPTIGQSATDKYSSYRANSADSTIATATATTGAGTSTYTLKNIVLAKAEQIRKTGLTIPPLNDGSQDGTLSIKVGTGAAVAVEVKGGSTLAAVRDAINASSAGVSASIINNGTADYLVLDSKSTGAANQITITGSNANWNSFDYTPPATPTSLYTQNSWTEQVAAESASVDINGLTITSSTNSISSAISGVTVNLIKESTTGTTVSVSKDTTNAITASLNAFVKAFNDAAKSMKDLGAYNASTQAAGALLGDATLRTSQSQISSFLTKAIGGSSAYQTLSNIGVALGKDGTLTLDTTKLSKAVETDFSGVSALVANVGTTFSKGMDGLIGTTGNIPAATESTNRMIKSLTQRQETMSLRLAQIETRYRKQFTALDTLVSSMNKTSTYLTQQLANLPGVASGK
jgi:flagellar hook-associated protein 2